MKRKMLKSIGNHLKESTTDLFSGTKIGKNTDSEKLFEIVRRTTRGIYKGFLGNKAVSDAFMELEREFNHVEFQYELANTREEF